MELSFNFPANINAGFPTRPVLTRSNNSLKYAIFHSSFFSDLVGGGLAWWFGSVLLGWMFQSLNFLQSTNLTCNMRGGGRKVKSTPPHYPHPHHLLPPFCMKTHINRRCPSTYLAPWKRKTFFSLSLAFPLTSLSFSFSLSLTWHFADTFWEEGTGGTPHFALSVSLSPGDAPHSLRTV